MLLFDSKVNSQHGDWKIVNDAVMGGKSTSQVTTEHSRLLLFEGHVSLENNGGFAMCQYHFNKKTIEGYSKFILNIKGDGKTYQFRVKRDSNDRHSYIYPFKTNGSSQTVEIPFSDMQPAFHGKKLVIDNFSSTKMEMIAFLIGNKKAEDFQLEIKSIQLQ